MSQRVYILDREHGAGPHYTSWIDGLSAPAIQVTEYDHDWLPPADAGLVVTIQHYQSPEVSILRRLVEQSRTPVLVLADGILEYRNTWQHPALPAGAIFQPAMGHKVACLGRAQARLLESWGNVGLCEVVGAPRWDALLGRPPRVRGEGPLRILVATAKTPAFTAEQRQRVLTSLRDMQACLQRTIVANRPIDVCWRLTAGLDHELRIAGTASDVSQEPLPQVLARVDAVITTPSTLLLEAQLFDLPTAILDYHNTPAYVPAAWTITAREHIAAMLAELGDPPAPRLLFQRTMLHDALECRTPAAPRMVRLAEAMLDIGRTCRARNAPLAFPQRILADAADDRTLPEASFDLRILFPEHPVFGNLDRARLQIEIGHLRAELARCQAARSPGQKSQGPAWKKILRDWLPAVRHPRRAA